LITVTAAIIECDGKILAARRKSGGHMAGRWEFPGGKVEPGETEEACLLRELQEELGIEAVVRSFFGESIYDYGERTIRLRAYLVHTDHTEFNSCAHDILLWLDIPQLEHLQWAPADWPLVHRLLRMHQE
jgi:8-oxo-dGTP diphosphatase